MASADVLLPSSVPAFGVAKRKFQVDELLSERSTMRVPRKVTFEPEKHLIYEEPKKVWSMADIGMTDKGISPTAVSEPFPLFSQEAIEQMRAEILSDAVQENCKYSSNIAKSQLRGFAPRFAPFVYDAWNSPEVLSIVSKIAGVELVPQFDLEIAHINLSSTTGDREEKAHRDADEGISGCPVDDDTPIVDWHTDSYPFVCVIMLSDCTNMVGGETALRKADGSIMKVRGPGMGHAVVMQGRYIEHQAMKATGTTERITMVTSFRPKSAFIKDDTVLTTVRSISDLSELYSQYAEYRLDILEERTRAHLREVRDRKRAGRGFDTASTKAWISEQKKFLESMLREMVDDDQVIKGYTDDSHLLSEASKADLRKRARI